MVIDEELPVGVIANTSAILGVTLGKYVPKQVGETVVGRLGKKRILALSPSPYPCCGGTKNC